MNNQISVLKQTELLGQQFETLVSRKSSLLSAWLNAESKFLRTKSNKLFSKNIWSLQNFFLSLQRLNFKCGTAASSRWQFLYPNLLKKNITAPCRVCGNAPGSSAFETLATRSAVFYAKISNVMSTLTINNALSLKEWTKAKSNRISSWFNAESKFFTRTAGFQTTRLLAIQVNSLFLSLILAGIAIEQKPMLSVLCAIAAAALVYVINTSDKKEELL